MNSNILMTESYKEKTSGTIESVSFDLEFYTLQKNVSNIQTYPSYPNPVQDFTKLGFELPEETCLTFILFDALGQKIWSDEECYDKGHHEITIDRNQFGKNRGVFYGKISNSKGWTNTWKIIVAD